MKLTDLEIHASPVTNIIYAGKMDKEKNKWSSERENVTSDVKTAITEWFANELLKGNKDAGFGFYLKDGRAIHVSAKIIEED